MEYALCPNCVKLKWIRQVCMVKSGDEVFLFTSLADAHKFAHGLPESIVEWKDVQPLGVAGWSAVMEPEEAG
jgi:hypothetical protein